MIKTEYNVPGLVHRTIALTSDLHEQNPEKVLAILKAVKPDVIAVPGDLFENHKLGENLDKEDESLVSRIVCTCLRLADKVLGKRQKKRLDARKEHAYRFLKEAGDIAPIVMSLGNHELFLTEEDRAVMNRAGVHFLHNSSVEVGGVLFGGIPSKQLTGEIDEDFLRTFSAQEGYKVLLCHHPEYYPYLSGHSINLILSGHCHGGQIRIAGRGVFVPGQGLFPKYHHGVYDGRLVVSSGLSNTSYIPRWGNETEVVIVRT